MGNTPERKSFPAPPKLPAHIKPRICRFGMKCKNDNCTYVHIKTKTGRSIASLGLGNELFGDLPKDLMSYEGGNLYSLDDTDFEDGGGVIIVPQPGVVTL